MKLRDYINQHYQSVNWWGMYTKPVKMPANANKLVNSFDDGKCYLSTKLVIARKCGLSWRELEKILTEGNNN